MGNITHPITTIRHKTTYITQTRQEKKDEPM